MSQWNYTSGKDVMYEDCMYCPRKLTPEQVYLSNSESKHCNAAASVHATHTYAVVSWIIHYHSLSPSIRVNLDVITTTRQQLDTTMEWHNGGFNPQAPDTKIISLGQKIKYTYITWTAAVNWKS